MDERPWKIYEVNQYDYWTGRDKDEVSLHWEALADEKPEEVRELTPEECRKLRFTVTLQSMINDGSISIGYFAGGD